MNLSIPKGKKSQDGMLVAEVLLGIFLISILGTVCLKIFATSVKALYQASEIELVESEISRATAALYAAQQLSPRLFGAPLSYWRELQMPQPEYLKNHLESLENTREPKIGSVLLEAIESGSLILSNACSYEPYRFCGEIHQIPLLAELREKTWLIINPLETHRWSGVPRRDFESGNTWMLTMPSLTSSVRVLYPLNAPKSNIQFETTPPLSILIPVLDHYIIYVTSHNELRRSSLIKNENQPLAIYIDNIRKENDECIISGTKGKHSRHINIPCQSRISEPFMRMDFLDL